MEDQLALLNAELATVNEQIVELARLKRYELFVQQRLTETDHKLRDARHLFQREIDSVVTLERISLERLWHTVAGDLSAVLGQEKRELLIAASSLKLTDDAYRTLSTRLDKIQSKIRRLGKLDVERDRILVQKEGLLETLGRPVDQVTQKTVAALQAQLATKRDQVREVFEALAAADRVDQTLVATRHQLGEIEAWQRNMADDDRVTDAMAKYRRIGETTRNLQQVHQALTDLTQELTDIDQGFQLPFDINAFGIFQKGFLQGFHVDWLVRDRLEDSDWGLNGIEYAVDKIRDQLRKLRKQLAREIGLLELRLNQTVEGWGANQG
jgi:hypothetical protein